MVLEKYFHGIQILILVLVMQVAVVFQEVMLDQVLPQVVAAKVVKSKI
jgi:hypothetical protein